MDKDQARPPPALQAPPQDVLQLVGKPAWLCLGRLAVLGHSPKGMAERHYTKAPLDLLAEAVEWLGAQFKVS